MSLLDTFIEQFSHIKDKALASNNPLYGVISRAKSTLSATALLNSADSALLQELVKSIDEPMKVAIIGQFSSGKSTFLNALLGAEILPSGITPITAKICHILYGADFALEIVYKNASVAQKPLAYLNEVSAAENAKIAFYKLYAPLELLKIMSFLDTPGFNSQNKSDTDTTNAVLESVDGIIWLSLIDNVGKQSEKDIIENNIKRYATKCLCVLNQKDRLKDEDEINTSIKYAKSAFAGLFEDIIAISARDALLSMIESSAKSRALRADSNIDLVINFLHNHIAPKAKEAKTHSILHKLRALLLAHAKQHTRAIVKLQHIARDMEAYVGDFTHIYEKHAFYKYFPTLYHGLESKLEALTMHIFSAITKKPHSFFTTTKTLGFSKLQEQIKEVASLPRERLNLGLNNADSALKRDFTKLGFDMQNASSYFKNLLESYTQGLEQLLDIDHVPLKDDSLKAWQDSATKQIWAHSMAAMAQFSTDMHLLARILQLNYTGAIALCLNSIDLKIQEATSKHSNNADMPLFNPSIENVRDELNMGFCYGLLQAALLTQPLHKKHLWQFERELKALCQDILSSLQTHTQAHATHLSALKSSIREIKGFKH